MDLIQTQSKINSLETEIDYLITRNMITDGQIMGLCGATFLDIQGIPLKTRIIVSTGMLAVSGIFLARGFKRAFF